MESKRKNARAPVNSLAGIDQPEVYLEGRLYPLRNLSVEGLAFKGNDEIAKIAQRKKILSAKLIFAHQDNDCELQFVHCTADTVGFKFLRLSETTQAKIQQILEPSVQASLLRPNEEHLKFDNEMNEKKLCYSGLNDSFIRVWFKEELGLIVALEIRYKSWIFYRAFQKEKRTQNQSMTSMGASQINQEIGQFLASAPKPIPGILLWQFLEMGEQVFLPKSVQTSHEAA